MRNNQKTKNYNTSEVSQTSETEKSVRLATTKKVLVVPDCPVIVEHKCFCYLISSVYFYYFFLLTLCTRYITQIQFVAFT